MYNKDLTPQLKLAAAVLFAAAAGAGAVTCTIDQRPAATLLIPWFHVTFNADGSPRTATHPTLGAALDTIVTFGNASAAPTIAHVSVFNERSTMVLDFNVALTAFDVQAMRMSEILRGNLPSTPVTASHVSAADDVCQRNPAAAVYPTGFLRVRPNSPATPEDNTLATALYPTPAFTQGGPFQLSLLDSLDGTFDSLGCNEAPDQVINEFTPIHGYLTIDMVNYCNLSNPSDPLYYANDAIGMENNLWGEVIYSSSTGTPAFGASTVNIEADRSFSNLANGGQFDQTATARTRTFYARYWSPTTENFCTNCGTGVSPTDLAIVAPWNRGFGDEREPLGLKYAARFFEAGPMDTHWIVWRASATVGPNASLTAPATFLRDLTTSESGAAGRCSSREPFSYFGIEFFDEDENSAVVSSIPLPSPLPPFEVLTINLETQRIRPPLNSRFPTGPVAGWASIGFRALISGGTVLDQAWVSYDFQPLTAPFLTAAVPATQLDPSTCNPLGVPIGPASPFPSGSNGPVVPVIPGRSSGTVFAGAGPAQ